MERLGQGRGSKQYNKVAGENGETYAGDLSCTSQSWISGI
jgi:hypothetical protein